MADNRVVGGEGFCTRDAAQSGGRRKPQDRCPGRAPSSRPRAGAAGGAWDNGGDGDKVQNRIWLRPDFYVSKIC